MSNRFPNGGCDDGWTWLNCVGMATAVQILLIILCFTVRIVQSMALVLVFLIFLYLPGGIIAVGADHLPMSASAVRILFLLSFAFYSVLFGSLFYWLYRKLHCLSNKLASRKVAGK